MKRRILVLPAAMVAFTLGAIGCNFSLSRNGEGGKVDRGFYGVYRGPLQVGRPYGTIRQNTFTEIGGDYDPAVSRDGKWLLYASTYHSPLPEIYLKTVNGATKRRLTSSPAAEIQPCFSPDGKRFAYASNSRGNWDIWTKGLDGGKPTPITRSADDEISPSYHPTKPLIAFSFFSGRHNRWEIGMRSTSGAGETIEIGEGICPRFSPDGKKLAFQRARTRSPRWYSIWTVEFDADMNIDNPTEVVSSAKWAAINPSWSPDSQYIAFATVHESPIAQHTRRILNGDDIWVVNVKGQDLIKLTEDQAPDSHPFWARDAAGKDRIYFCSMRKGPKNIWSLTPKLPGWRTVIGPSPGPKPKNTPAPASPPRDGETDRPGELRTYMTPPAPVVSAGGSAY
jgi:Tol biopolymer transport system component